MVGSYAESRCKKLVTAKDNFTKFLMIAGIVVPIILIPVTGYGILGLLSLLMVAVTAIFWKRLSIEYEYVFCDGQVDFDRIAGGESRKTLYRADFDQLVVIAPAKSHALDGYRHNGVEVRDYSSLDPNHKIFGMVVTSGEKSTLIYFEPDENMLAAMKQKAPRKISEV
ncbi:MAG: DUF6106 family protein [Lachnospiraceae bacterium]|nr:DUF6106 family protein [Lachnospiraceae bacterium]